MTPAKIGIPSGFYLAPLCIVAFAGLHLLPTSTIEALTYQRTAISQGELWRLISAHFVHLSGLHLLLNSLALLAFQWLYGREFTLRRGLLTVGILCLGISLGLYWGTPNVDWYRGFSGVVIGLLIAGALLNFRQYPRFNAAVCLVIAAKLTLEQLHGQAVITTSFNHLPTVVDAHLYGAATTLVCCSLELALQRLRRFICQTGS